MLMRNKGFFLTTRLLRVTVVVEILNTPCQFCAVFSLATADCARSGYIGGQLVRTRALQAKAIPWMRDNVQE